LIPDEQAGLAGEESAARELVPCPVGYGGRRLTSAVCWEYARKFVGGQALVLVTGSQSVVCKSIAKASKVRILHLPPRAERALDLRKRWLGALLCGPAVIGSNRLFTVVREEYGRKLRHSRLLGTCRQCQRGLDAYPRDFILAVDALRVDPEEDIHAVSCPFGDLGRRDAGIQPKRNDRVAQVVRAFGQRRGTLAIGESGSTCRSPDSMGGAHAQGLCEGRWQRNAGATNSGDEQAAVGARGECLDVLAEDLDGLRRRWHRSRVADTTVLQLAVPVCLAGVGPGAADVRGGPSDQLTPAGLRECTILDAKMWRLSGT
jgi:hypothetical protein